MGEKKGGGGVGVNVVIFSLNGARNQPDFAKK